MVVLSVVLLREQHCRAEVATFLSWEPEEARGVWGAERHQRWKGSLGRVVRPWQGLPREVWSAQPWRCPRKAWPWHSVLWAGGQGGQGAQRGIHDLGSFSNFRDPGITISVMQPLEQCSPASR